MHKIIAIIKQEHFRQILIYGIVGLCAFATQAIAYIYFCYINLSPVLANIFACFLGMIVGYIGHTKYTFLKPHIFSKAEFLRYVIVSCVGIIFNTIGIYLLINKWHYPHYFGVIPMIFAPIITFIVNKFWAFKDAVISNKPLKSI